MTLLRAVIDALRQMNAAHALIGAAAMAVHGVSRATADMDLLTTDTAVLRPEAWATFERRGVRVRVLRGDADDPLAGTVRLSEGPEVVDVVVGRFAWQREVIDRAAPASVAGVDMPVAGAAGIVLLKLYAGGPKDAWDVRSLLEAHADPVALTAEVEGLLPRLDAESRRLWTRIVTEE
jgi:hypothetical protein